ncbi:MAG: hypothetical protein LBT21_00560 [Oscillospiraceae bacterium]|nr:hypothetical protein [Oscillospiraceae bacterium]
MERKLQYAGKPPARLPDLGTAVPAVLPAVPPKTAVAAAPTRASVPASAGTAASARRTAETVLILRN